MRNETTPQDQTPSASRKEAFQQSVQPSLPNSEPALTRYLLQIGLTQAHRLQILGDDAEEAALTFTERLYDPVRFYQQSEGDQVPTPPWIYHAARNHMLNFQKAEQRRKLLFFA